MKKYIILSLAMVLGSSFVTASFKENQKQAKYCNKLIKKAYKEFIFNKETSFGDNGKFHELLAEYNNSPCVQIRTSLIDIFDKRDEDTIKNILDLNYEKFQ